jgi:hypothetical protein
MDTGFIPIKIDDVPVFAIAMKKLLNHQEITKLNEYVNKLFDGLDDNRRKKFAIVKNKQATKQICKRIKMKSYKFDGETYEFSHYCENIEIVRWLKDKCVSDKPYCDMTNNKYRIRDPNDKIIYITCVVGIDPPSSITKIVLDGGVTPKIVKSSRNRKSDPDADSNFDSDFESKLESKSESKLESKSESESSSESGSGSGLEYNFPFEKIKISDSIALMYCESYLKLQEEISVEDHTQLYFHMVYRAKVIPI